MDVAKGLQPKCKFRRPQRAGVVTNLVRRAHPQTPRAQAWAGKGGPRQRSKRRRHTGEEARECVREGGSRVVPEEIRAETSQAVFWDGHLNHEGGSRSQRLVGPVGAHTPCDCRWGTWWWGRLGVHALCGRGRGTWHRAHTLCGCRQGI